MSNYYELLEIKKDSTIDEIKRAYKKLAFKYHPDKNTDNDNKEQNELQFKKITEAYEVLSDPDKKHQYDNPQLQMNNHAMHVNINDLFRQMNQMQQMHSNSININLGNGNFRFSFQNNQRQRGNCPHCNGTGRRTTVIQTGNMIQQLSQTCGNCRGSGNC